VPTQITNYQCPACTGPLQFDGSSGKVECPFCGSVFTVEEIEKLYAQADEQAAQAQADADAEREQGDDNWDTSGLSGDWGGDADGMRAYNCPSCGAQLITDETTAATSCPYCGNPTIIPGQFADTLRPDYVIPFRLTKDDAIKALKKHYEGRPFLPNTFSQANHLEEIKGVYVPFWLFDGEGEGEMHFEATRSKTYRKGEYKITETAHYDVYRAGKVTFERIPVDGSGKMPDDYMDSIEPFDYDALTPFSKAYLPGFLADKYDVSAEECSKRADLRAENSVIDCLRDTVEGYETVVSQEKNIRLHRGEVKYALLPVWLLTTKWNGSNYLFAMNGQTGKFVGNLPVDKGKKRRIFGAVYAAAALVTAAIVLFPGGLLRLLGM